MSIKTEHIWEAFHAPLRQFIRARVPDDTTTEDILQDVFLKIHQHIEGLKDVKKLESWVYQITRNAIIDFYRSREQSKESLETPEALGLAEELPDDDVVSELFPSVRAMVTNLPEHDRQARIASSKNCLSHLFIRSLSQKTMVSSSRFGLAFSPLYEASEHAVRCIRRGRRYVRQAWSDGWLGRRIAWGQFS